MCLSQAVLSHLVRDIMQLCFSPSLISSVQLLSRVRLCNPMNRSTPGLPVHHQLPESTQTHVHQVGDAIQPSHPLSSPSPPGIFPSIQVFSNESALHIRCPKYWSFFFSFFFFLASTSVLPMNTQDRSPLEWTGWISLQSKGLSSAPLIFQSITPSPCNRL